MAFWKKKSKISDEFIEKEIQRELEEMSSDSDYVQTDAESVVTETTEQKNVTNGDSDMAEVEPQILKPSPMDDATIYVEESCEAVLWWETCIQDKQREYDIATSCLSDIQILDRLEGEEKKKVEEYCGNIVNLTKERNRFMNQNLSITAAQIKRLKPFENELVDEIKKMYEQESYQKAIDGDIEKLVEEKKNLYLEEEKIVQHQSDLKTMAKVVSVMILSLFVLFLTIYIGTKKDMTIPYMATIVLAGVSVLVIFLEANSNRKNMILTQRKMNRAIELLNGVKIKYINNQNVLSYNKEKFGVTCAEDFENLWGQYTKAIEYEKRFQENTNRLSENSSALTELLKKKGLHDPDIWVSQAVAVVDNREMVEIRHELNVKRQELRGKIAQAIAEKKSLLAEMDDFIRDHPNEKEELLKIIQKKVKSPLTKEM